MFEAIHRCRPYLLGAPFIVRCNNRALSYLQNYRDLTHRTARMLEILADYDFKVQFLAGKKNVSADALSRIEWPFGECPWTEVDKDMEVVAPVVHDVQEPVLNWTAEQEADEDISIIKQWLVAGERPPKETVSGTSGAVRSAWASYEQMALQDGVVCRVWTDEGSLPDRNLKLVPTSWRKRILEGHHELMGPRTWTPG